jgi:dynein heavy chain
MYIAEPSNDIPTGLLQKSIKVTSGSSLETKANFMHALALFNDDSIEQCQKDKESKPLLYHHCILYAIMLERRKFRPQGFNRIYNFSTSDIQICL